MNYFKNDNFAWADLISGGFRGPIRPWLPIQFGYRLCHPPSKEKVNVRDSETGASSAHSFIQGTYVAARAGVEPTTLRLRVIDLTNAPPRPTYV